MADDEHSDLDETLDVSFSDGDLSDQPPEPGGDPAETGPVSTRFRLGLLLGEGGAAQVVEAQDTRLARTVAVKKLRQELHTVEDARNRLFEEAKVLAGMYHPGIVPVYDAGYLEGGDPFYAMEKVRGVTFSKVMRDRSGAEIGSRSSLLHLVDLFAQVCRTMAYAHDSGVIHRDLKPANVMVDEYGSVYVMDWGLAKRLVDEDSGQEDTEQTRAGVVMGTPKYMSPEQAQGLAEAADRRTDVFALGVMLYEILTGIQPFIGRNLKEVIDDVVHHHPKPPVVLNPAAGRELSAICMKALEKSLRERYRSAKEMAEDIRRAREFLPVSVLKPRLVDRIGGWARRHRATASILGTLLAVGLLVAGIIGFETWKEHRVLARISERLDLERTRFGELSAQHQALSARLELLPPGDPDRARLSGEIKDLQAEMLVQRWEIHGRITAMVGFTLFSPDEELLATAREESLDIIRTAVDRGEYAAARAFIRATLDQVDRANVFQFSGEEIREMERILVQAGSSEAR